MPLFFKARSFLRNLFATRRMDKDLDAEVQSHLDMLAQENVSAGMSASEAQRAARIELGGVEQVKEQVREQRMGNWVQSVFADCRFALRQLRKSPAFTAVAVLTLGLGIGANTAIFSMVNSVLFRPLPYYSPEKLVWLSDYMPRQHDSLVIESDYYAWRSQNHAFTDVAAYELGDTLTLTGTGDPQRLRAARATYNFLDVLGVQPQLGRMFHEEEDRPGAPGVALISESLWRERFGSNPAVIGQSIKLDGDLYTVIGVLASQFEFLDNTPADIIVPFALENHEMTMEKSMRIVQVVGRLRSGVTPTTAVADLDTINARLYTTYPPAFANMFKGFKSEVVPLRERLLGKSRPALLVLLGAVGFVLLIACANIASLQLARGVSREKEIAIRGALGAGKWRVIRQLLTESVVLAFAGGLCGLLFSLWLIRILVHLSPADVPHLSLAHLDLRVLCFTLAATVLAGVSFGLAPAFASVRLNLVESLKEAGTQPGMGLLGRGAQGAIIVVELAAALVLLSGSALFLKSFLRLATLPPGFDGQGVFTARLSLPPNLYSTDAQQISFYEQIVQQSAALPGVTSAAVASILPLQGSNNGASVELEGRPPEAAGHAPQVEIVKISPRYFQVLRIPLISGTLFDPHNEESDKKLLVVNQTFVKRFFPGEDPIGRRVLLAKEEYWTIVGVVADTKQFGLTAPVKPGAFVSIATQASSEMAVLIRTSGQPLALLPAVRSIIGRLDKNLPLYDVVSMHDLLHEQTSSQRFSSLLLSSFAMLALLLACLGVYGVTAYAVSQRIREFGLRMALGAKPQDVLLLILRQAAVPALIGIVGGAALSLVLAKFIGSMLFAVRPSDPTTFLGMSLLLLAVVGTATYVPAQRAARSDPMVALRYE